MTEAEKREFEEFKQWKANQAAAQANSTANETKELAEDSNDSGNSQQKESNGMEANADVETKSELDSKGGTKLPEVKSNQENGNNGCWGVAVLIVAVVLIVWGYAKCSDGVRQAALEDPTGIASDADVVSDVEEAPTLKVGPDEPTWVAYQYESARYDSIKLAKKTDFEIVDGETMPEDLQTMINSLKAIINDEGYQISSYPEFFSTGLMAKKLAHNHKTAKRELDKRLPQYRKYYVKAAGQILWKHDMKVRANGKTIWFIGAQFASNANIQEFQDGMGGKLRNLGFTRVCYKWIDANVEYTYYDL